MQLYMLVSAPSPEVIKEGKFTKIGHGVENYPAIFAWGICMLTRPCSLSLQITHGHFLVDSTLYDRFKHEQLVKEEEEEEMDAAYIQKVR